MKSYQPEIVSEIITG